MVIEIKIPSPGESISEVTLANWMVDDGSFVEKDQEIGEIESDKATLPLIALDSGKIEILIQAGSNAKIGDIACKIDTDQKGIATKKDQNLKVEVKEKQQEKPEIKEEKKNVT